MKIITAFLFAFQLAASLFSQQTTSQKLDELITVYASFNKFNGTVLIARHGEILLEKGYGFKNVRDQTVNDPHTIFQVGSITKEFTATVILKLAEQKKLKLTDPLIKYFPDFPGGDSITIRNLLTHTSGIFNYTEIKDFWNQLSLHTTAQAVMDTLKKRPLLFQPGEKFSYSNSNYMLLAYIIQKLTHKSYETVVRDWIFKPLGMSHSGFDFTGLKDPNKAKGYWDFSLAKYTEGPLSDSSEFIGSGEIYSTAGDLYKWHLALQSGKILSKALQLLAYQPYRGQYGYGWELDTIYSKDIRVVGHGGRVFGFESKMIRIPEDNVFVILLNNDSDGPYLHMIGEKILAIIYQQPYTMPEKPLQLSEEMLKAHTGIYAADEKHSFEVRLVNGHLFGVEGPDRMHELFPMKNNRFRFMEHEGEEGTFEFLMDEYGKAKEISTITRGGIKLTLKKIK